jgi:hypothetical protein
MIHIRQWFSQANPWSVSVKVLLTQPLLEHNTLPQLLTVPLFAASYTLPESPIQAPALSCLLQSQHHSSCDVNAT